MKKTTLLISLVFIISLINAQNSTDADIWTGDRSSVVNVNLKSDQPLLPMSSGTVLFDNGPLINSPGTGAGGADESVVQNSSLGMSTYGFGFQYSFQYWIADDFTVPSSGWDISKFVFYGYQTSSPTTSTITAIHFLIYDGVPGQPGTNIVWGNTSTNRLTNSQWTNIYRVLETSSGNTNRPIMENTCNISLHLNAGTYWVAWQADGSLSSGPWAPPITINGQTVTGNGLQSLDSLATWSNVSDGSSNGQQGFPFVIYGPEPVPISNWAIILGILLIVAFTVYRYRRRLA